MSLSARALITASILASTHCAPARAPRAPEGRWIDAASEGAPVVAPPPPAPKVAKVGLATCGNGEEGFAGWLEAFREHALGHGISARTAAIALDGITYDGGVIDLDRSQSAFKLSFAEFAKKRITPARLARGREEMRERAELLSSIEAKHAVAPEILVAIWGLETDYGANVGHRSSLRALATLAWDCRRSARFRDELLAALRLVERGDLTPAEMIGAWAGELGQTQFLPSSYERFAVDFDGDGRANLLGSSADALASTAAYLQGHGWRAGEGYDASAHNFSVLGSWNASEIYRKTIVLFAEKLAGSRRRER